MPGLAFPMTTVCHKITVALAFAVACCAFGLYETRALALFPSLIDDYWISLIYSRNLAEGWGPVFNTGGLPRAEGYTSFLWMALMALPYLFHADGAVIAKIASLLFGTLALAAAGGLAFRYARPFPAPQRLLAAATAMLLLGAFPSFELNSVYGMESTLAAFLALGLFYSLDWHREAPSRRKALLMGVFALLLGLTRPEANLLNVIVLAGAALPLRNGERKPFARAVCASYILPGVTYFAWRVWYYGHWFPLPFYVKQGSLDGEMTGTDYVTQFFVKMPFPFLALALAGLVVSGRRSWLPAAAALAAIVSFAHSCPLNGVKWRYFVPYYPVFFSLAGVGILAPLRFRTRRTLAGLAGAATVGVVFTCAWAFTQNFAALKLQQAQVARGLRVNHVRFGKMLAEVRRANPKLTVACGDAGAIEYYARCRFVDENRLNDAHLALRADGDACYVARFHPDLIVVQSTRPDKFVPQGAVRCQAAYYHLALQSHMTLLAALRCDPCNNFLIYGYGNSRVGDAVRAFNAP